MEQQDYRLAGVPLGVLQGSRLALKAVLNLLYPHYRLLAIKICVITRTSSLVLIVTVCVTLRNSSSLGRSVSNSTATTEMYTLSLHGALPFSGNVKAECGPSRSAFALL